MKGRWLRWLVPAAWLLLQGCPEDVIGAGDAVVVVDVVDVVDVGPALDVQDVTGDSGTEAVDPYEVDSGAPYVFEEYPWLQNPPDVDERICAEAADPAGAADTTFITCDMEGESFVPLATETPAGDSIVVMAYNLERGRHVDEQIAVIRDDPVIPVPDILLISEADRGCDRSDGRHVTRELAAALEMSYVFAVEFVELDSTGDEGVFVAECEHGNAILSRYPLGNVRQIRHAVQASWYDSKDEPRLGGRVVVAADADVGGRIVHLYSVHFESSLGQEERTAQAAETADDGVAQPHLAIIGGDMNTGLFALDLTFGTETDTTYTEITSRGFFDAHRDLPRDDRITAPDHGFILDLLFASEDVFSEPGICSAACETLSDHYPVWATVDLSDQPVVRER